MMYCQRCHYVLDHLDSRRCPECGRAFDPGDPSTYRTAARWRVLPDVVISAGSAAVLHGLHLLTGRRLTALDWGVQIPFLVLWLVPAVWTLARGDRPNRLLAAASLVAMLNPVGLEVLARWYRLLTGWMLSP